MTDLQLIIRVAALLPVIVAFIFLYFVYYRFKRESEFQRKQLLLEKDKAEVELKALKSQMNPHFIFNSLQSIHHFISSHKNEQAEEYLLKFSRLIRLILENSNKKSVTLDEELEALTIYMQLEALRFQQPFDYKINIAGEINKESTYIPPLLIQPFVENSIWHGIKNRTSGGLIQISVSAGDKNLIIRVEDNGKLSDKKETVSFKRQSLGMAITRDRIKLYNESSEQTLSVSTEEIFDENKIHCGNVVEFFIPLDTDE